MTEFGLFVNLSPVNVFHEVMYILVVQCFEPSQSNCDHTACVWVEVVSLYIYTVVLTGDGQGLGINQIKLYLEFY